MHSGLRKLQGICLGSADEAIATIVLVNAVDTGAATRLQQSIFGGIHYATRSLVRSIIDDFSNEQGVFNLDHMAWQYGLDVTPEGPVTEIDVPEHVCVEEDMIYQGHYGAPGKGSAHECSICHRRWAKIGDTFYEESTNMHMMTIDDVR